MGTASTAGLTPRSTAIRTAVQILLLAVAVGGVVLMATRSAGALTCDVGTEHEFRAVFSPELSEPSNWEDSRLPSPTEDVCIPEFGGPTEMVLTDGTLTINRIRSSQPIRVRGTSVLTVGPDNGTQEDSVIEGDFLVESGTVTLGHPGLVTDTLTVTGNMRTDSGTTRIEDQATVLGDLTHTGGVLAGLGTLTGMGDFIWGGGQLGEFGDGGFNGRLDIGTSGGECTAGQVGIEPGSEPHVLLWDVNSYVNMVWDVEDPILTGDPDAAGGDSGADLTVACRLDITGGGDVTKRVEADNSTDLFIDELNIAPGPSEDVVTELEAGLATTQGATLTGARLILHDQTHPLGSPLNGQWTVDANSRVEVRGGSQEFSDIDVAGLMAVQGGAVEMDRATVTGGVDVSGTGQLFLQDVVDFRPGSALTSTREVEVGSAGDVTVQGTWDHTGTLDVDGSINFDTPLANLDFVNSIGTITSSGNLIVDRWSSNASSVHDGVGVTDIVGTGFGSTLNGTVDTRTVRLLGKTVDIIDLTIAGGATVESLDPTTGGIDTHSVRFNASQILAGPGSGVLRVGDNTTWFERFPNFASFVEPPMTVSAGGTFIPRGDFEMTGDLTVEGTVDIVNNGGNPDTSFTVPRIDQNGGTFLLNEVSPDPILTVALGSWSVQGGGLVQGDGIVDGTLSLTNGELAVGDSPGLLELTRNFHLHSASTMTVEIDGPTPGTEFDQITVGRRGELLGTIIVDIADDYLPADGTEFAIVRYADAEEINPLEVVDADPGDNKDIAFSHNGQDAIITVTTVADLSVNTDVTGTMLTGEDLAFEITVDNAGPLQANNVVVVNELPDNVALTSATPGCTYQPAPVNVATCFIDSLAADGSGSFATLDLTGRVTGPGTFDNITSVSSDQGDDNEVNDTDTDTISVTPTANLEIAGFASTPSPTRGDPVSETFFITNDGPDDATDITLTVDLPAGFDVTNPPGGCEVAQDPDQVICDGLAVPSGHLDTITIDGVATELGQQITTATVATPNFEDANGAATTVTFTTQPPSGPGSGTADVGVQTTVTPDAGLLTGDVVTIDIIASNDTDSPDPSTNTTVTVALPDNTRLAAVAAGACGYQPGTNTVICDLGQLAPGATAAIQLTADVTGPGGGDITTTISADQVDENPANDTDVDPINVPATADLGVSLLISDATPTVRDSMTTTVLITNDGPDAASDVATSIAIPAGYDVTTLPDGCVTEIATTIICFTESVAPGAVAAIQVDGTINQTGTRTVTVDVQPGEQTDPAVENNTDQVTYTASNPPRRGGGGTVGTAQEVTVSLIDVTVLEGDDGSTQIEVTAVLSQPVPFDVTLTLDVTDLTSSLGRDFVLPTAFAQLNELLTIKGGDTSATLLIDIVGDSTPEPDEQFTVAITDVQPATVIVEQDTATITITDDDEASSPFGLEPVTFSDTCLVDPQGPGLQAKTDTVVSNANMALMVLGCSGLPDGGSVVLSRDDDFADSLASGVLQGDSPLMLVPSAGEIPADTMDALQTINPSSVVIVGGEAAVSPGIADQIAALGIDVSRRDGATRLETAIDIAATDAPAATTAIIARAFPNPDATDATQAFADAIAAGGMAADLGFPILLTETEALSASTAAYLADSAITDLFIMGGTAAVSAQVERQLDELMTGDIQRVTGANRFGTAVEAATIRGTDSAADAAEIILLEGQDDDAWAAGFTAAYPSAQTGAPIVLVNGGDVPEATAAFLTPNAQGQFAVSTSPPSGEQPLTCAAQDDACAVARRLLGLSGVSVTFGPPALGPANPGQVIAIGLSPALPDSADLVIDGSCLRDPVTDIDSVVIREDLPPLPCTVDVTITFANGTVQTTTSAYGEAPPEG